VGQLEGHHVRRGGCQRMALQPYSCISRERILLLKLLADLAHVHLFSRSVSHLLLQSVCPLLRPPYMPADIAGSHYLLIALVVSPKLGAL
jgi:hypothetical protein